MPESTQVLVKKYFELIEGYFLQENAKFKVPGNYSDIDLIGVNKKGECLIVEVKSWATENVTMANGKGLVDWLASSETTKAAKDILGDISKIRRVLVVAWLGSRGGVDLVRHAKSLKNPVDVMTMDRIIKGLFEKVDPNLNYDDEGLQLLRLLKIYSDKSWSRQPPVTLEFPEYK